jgi:mRNA interferase RelE/StbE
MWKIVISKQSDKFLDKNSSEVKGKIISKIRNLRDWLENREKLTIDLKKLKGDYTEFYRIRSGNIRIIISIDNQNHIIRIQNINFRESIY